MTLSPIQDKEVGGSIDMSPQSISACCKKGAQRIGNVLYCSTCGVARPVAVATLREDPLLPERKKYDAMRNSTPGRLP